jgi:Zn/Cd-binding protein ZinT
MLVGLIAESGEVVQGNLNPIQQRHLSDFEGIWQSVLQSLDENDAFWDWAMKKRLSTADNRFEAYAIEYKGLTQCLV